MRLPGVYLILLLSVAGVGRVSAQDRWGKLDDWMADNAKEMGGRAILVVYKDGKVAYMRSVNDMSRRQKMVTKFISRRRGRKRIRATIPLRAGSPLRAAASG
ncbi:hypothetical protein ACQ86N_04325 [Puia sp. P3]|uniref:hypothetical protein n=1 Tax=Puia sp. P3 TaxID=3423952 RepID=UPI003D67FB55